MAVQKLLVSLGQATTSLERIESMLEQLFRKGQYEQLNTDQKQKVLKAYYHEIRKNLIIRLSITLPEGVLGEDALKEMDDVFASYGAVGTKVAKFSADINRIIRKEHSSQTPKNVTK